ncbi:MAG: HEPN domain-containing protein [Betaproteobacteria bacterium]|nr:HEPN domain-containing protein [Betaproteobacteria bacterium]
MRAQDFFAKASRAAASAKMLLDAGDADGACSRAYYAMFDAARAALLASGAPVQPEVAKTHSGLISAFSLHLVKTGRVAAELGKALNRAGQLRLVADYKGDPIEAEDAAWVVSQADVFVAAMQDTFMPKASK